MKKRVAVIVTALLAVLALGLAACNDSPKKYTVTFDYNYPGAPAAVTRTVEENELADAPIFTRDGATFAGWYTDDSCSVDKAFDVSSKKITGNITLYAKWDLSAFSVRYVSYDGTVISEQSIEYGKAADAPAENQIPQREGYKFTGWSADGTNITADTVITASYEYQPSADTFFSYAEIKNETEAVTGYSVSLAEEPGEISGTLYLPKTHKTKPVSIAPSGFTGLSEAEIFIPDTYAEIPASAFKASGITKVKYDYGCKVETIGKEAFAKTALTEITIPASVTEVGEKAFFSVITATGLSFEDNSSLTSIGNYAFGGNNSASSAMHLEEIFVPASVETVGEYAFAYNIDAASLTFGEGSALTSIPKYAFVYLGYNNTKKEDITGYSFEVEIPSLVTDIGDRSFMTSGITKVTIPVNVERIGVWAFSQGNNKTDSLLSSVVFEKGGDKDLVIDYSAFAGYYSSSTSFVTGALTAFEIPARCTEIRDTAFALNNNLSSLTFEAGASKPLSIGAYAFSGGVKTATAANSLNSATPPSPAANKNWATAIQSLSFPSDREVTVGRGAFASSQSLASVTFNDKVTLIDFAFCFSNNIAALDLTGITEIPQKAFMAHGNAGFGNTALTSLTIPASVTAIGNSAFENCGGIDTLNIADGATALTIGDSAFATGNNCLNESITSIAIPDRVTAIGNYAFKNYRTLKTVTFGASPTISSIGTFFGQDTAIESFTVPGSVTSIGNAFFRLQKVIRTVEFAPGEDIEIEKWFLADTSITAFEVPSRIKDLGTYAFLNAPITAYTVQSGHAAFSAAEGVLYNADGTEIVRYPASKTGEIFTAAETVVSVGAYAFMNAFNLKTVSLPKVTQMDEYAFSYDSTSASTYDYFLESVTAPELTDMSVFGNQFKGCETLKSVDIGKVTAIPQQAFNNCKLLSSVTLTAGNVTSLGNNSFFGCAVLKDFDLGSFTELTSIGQSAFQNSGIGSFTDGAKTGKLDLSGLTKLTSIGNYAFNGAASLVSITIPDSVTSLGNSTFQKCSALTSVSLGAGITALGTSLFSDCTALQSLYINADTALTFTASGFNATFPADRSNLTVYLKNYAAYNVYKTTPAWANLGLKGIEIDPGKLDTTNSDYTVDANGVLVSYNKEIGADGTVVIDGAGIVAIGAGVFGEKAASVKNLTFGAEIKSIMSGATSGCLNLTELHIGAGYTVEDGKNVPECKIFDQMADCAKEGFKIFFADEATKAAYLTDENWAYFADYFDVEGGTPDVPDVPELP